MEEVVLAEADGKKITFALVNGVAYLNGEPAPIKGITDADVENFRQELAKLPSGDTDGHQALLNAVRVAFIAKLLSHAVGDECVDELTRILGQAHDVVINYLES